MRLAGGTCNRGRLEVLHASQWGTVCDKHFSNADAAVFCRSMGKPHANAEAIMQFGGGSGLIHLDEVNCDGVLEWKSCRHSGWGVHACDHSQDVGLNCH
uniref:SRCR domain-containing protein n=1 Tax=Capitella teleta TaxID=283909 RepID=X1Z176_CAPTE